MSKIDLIKLYNQGIVKKGVHNLNVPIKKFNGESYSGETYMIPLEYLYYNDQNGRIGVALSEYESTNGRIIPGHNEEYNLAIQNMIINDGENSTKKEMEKLKRDMHVKGQQEAGYVLKDGRVIDGNRRFTAKRLLQQDADITGDQYFEAVILNDLSFKNHDDQKKIKSLELQIQFGKLGKVDYHAIDRAIDAYKTVKVNNIMTAKEYSEYAGFGSTNEVNKRILEAELIVRFLEFSNADPENYALAKQLELDGPIQDLIPQYKKFKGQDNETQLLDSIFTKILQIRITKEDYKKSYREIVKNVVGTKKESNFIEEMEDVTDLIVDALDSSEPIKSNIELTSVLASNKSISTALSEVQDITGKFSESVKNHKERTMPITLMTRAINSLSSIDISVIPHLESKDKYQLLNKLEELKFHIDAIKSAGE